MGRGENRKRSVLFKDIYIEETVEKVFQDGIVWIYFLRVLRENRNVSTRSLSTRE